jgi:hypothetical protein
LPNPYAQATMRDKLERLYHGVNREVPEEFADISFDYVTPDDPEEYKLAVQKAYTFFRASAEGRYSARTMERLQNYGEDVTHGYTEPDTSWPVIFSANLPYSYDELREEKRGGLVGMAILWRYNDYSATTGRLILAAGRSCRRKFIGSTLLQSAMYFGGGFRTWVGSSNVPGQKFLLSNNLQPSSVSNRSICYTTGEDESDAEEATLTSAWLYDTPSTERRRRLIPRQRGVEAEASPF